MVRNTRSALHGIEVVLAVGVLLIAFITVADLPRPYPSWPTIGPVPVDPELVLPGLLGLAVLARTIRDGLSIGSVVTGLLGGITLWIALTSLYTLYAAEMGGVFWGGFFSLISGGVLAISVLVRGAVRQSTHRGVSHHFQTRFRK